MNVIAPKKFLNPENLHPATKDLWVGLLHLRDRYLHPDIHVFGMAENASTYVHPDQVFCNSQYYFMEEMYGSSHIWLKPRNMCVA